jgi:hypothetical protein
MENRTKKLARIVAVQQRLSQIAEIKVAAIGREKSALEKSQTELIAALNDDDALQGVFIEAMARRLASLGRESDKVRDALEAATGQMLTQAMRLQRMERMSEAARREYLQEFWKKGFADILDTLVTR